MITSNKILYKIKCGAIGAFLMFTATLSAQQLHSDSVVAAKTEQSLCMVLPDTTNIFLELNTQTFDPATAILSFNESFVTQSCGECFSYSQSYLNLASLFVSPVWAFTTAAVSPNAQCFIAEPIGAESIQGIAVAAPVHGIQFAAYISDAAKHLSTVIQQTHSLESDMT